MVRELAAATRVLLVTVISLLLVFTVIFLMDLRSREQNITDVQRKQYRPYIAVSYRKLSTYSYILLYYNCKYYNCKYNTSILLTAESTPELTIAGSHNKG
jgi:hypothetical protein